MSTIDAQASLLADDVPEFGEEHTTGSASRLRHPWATGFHLLFRTSALVLYLLCERLALDFVLTFVLTTLLLSADFWTVKNVSGRLLVGLRWWNVVDEDGNSRWVFESRQSNTPQGNAPIVLPSRPSSLFEQRVFWVTLFVCPLMWFLLILSSLLGFHYVYMVLPIMGFILSSANLYGYLRCRYGTGSGLFDEAGSLGSQMTLAFLRQQIRQRVSGLFGKRQTNSTQQTV